MSALTCINTEDEAQEIRSIVNDPRQSDPSQPYYCGLMGMYCNRTVAIGESLVQKGATPEMLRSFVITHVPKHLWVDIDIVWTHRIPKWRNSNVELPLNDEEQPDRVV